MSTPTMKQITRTPWGNVAKAMRARQAVSAQAEMNMHSAGTRAERAKKKWDAKRSRERHCKEG